MSEVMNVGVMNVGQSTIASHVHSTVATLKSGVKTI